MPPRIKVPSNIKAKLDAECNKLVLRIRKAAGDDSDDKKLKQLLNRELQKKVPRLDKNVLDELAKTLATEEKSGAASPDNIDKVELKWVPRMVSSGVPWMGVPLAKALQKAGMGATSTLELKFFADPREMRSDWERLALVNIIATEA